VGSFVWTGKLAWVWKRRWVIICSIIFPGVAIAGVCSREGLWKEAIYGATVDGEEPPETRFAIRQPMPYKRTLERVSPG